MNIAIVTPEFVSESNYDGGLANYTYKLAKWLIENGNRVTVFLVSNNEKSFDFDGIAVKSLKIKDYAWHLKYNLNRIGLGSLISDSKLYRYHFKKQSKFVSREISKYNIGSKIDIVHYPHLGGFGYIKVNKVPSIVRLSGSTELCQNFGGYGSENNKVKEQIWIELEAMKKADAVFGPSKAIASFTEPQIERKIKILETPYVKPEGQIDESIYNQYLSGKNYILFFGSIGLIKGVGTIAEIIYPLLKKNEDLYYVFVGKQVHNQIEGIDVWDYLIKKAGELKDRVIYIPSQKHSTLFPIIKNAKLITLPSRTDNFPNTCIESMANHKIVIGTKGNGFDQLINDGENGFVIDVDDHHALLEKINLVLNMSSQQKEEMENLSFKRSELLHPDIVLNQLVDLYKETIRNYNK